jgi:hypothetical protein
VERLIVDPASTTRNALRRLGRRRVSRDATQIERRSHSEVRPRFSEVFALAQRALNMGDVCYLDSHRIAGGPDNLLARAAQPQASSDGQADWHCAVARVARTTRGPGGVAARGVSGASRSALPLCGPVRGVRGGQPTRRPKRTTRLPSLRGPRQTSCRGHPRQRGQPTGTPPVQPGSRHPGASLLASQSGPQGSRRCATRTNKLSGPRAVKRATVNGPQGAAAGFSSREPGHNLVGRSEPTRARDPTCPRLVVFSNSCKKRLASPSRARKSVTPKPCKA